MEQKQEQTAEQALLEAKESVALKDGYRDWYAIPYHLYDEYYSRAAHLYTSQQTASLIESLRIQMKTIDRLQEEVERLKRLLKNLLPMAEDGYTLHKKNGSHQEFLSEDRELLQEANKALSGKESNG
jgi:uncharacterized protein YdeI (YjbR/CyaY-like superfamily)